MITVTPSPSRACSRAAWSSGALSARNARAPAAHGPWTTYARVPAIPKCDRTVCNTYFASWIPLADAGRDDVIGLSHNVWGGDLSWVNRPSFLVIDPPGSASRAARCSLVDCQPIDRVGFR